MIQKREICFIGFLIATLSLISACSSKLIVQSEPSDADVLLSVGNQKERVKAGKTPLEMSERQLAELLHLSPQRTDLITVHFEKKEFEEKDVLVPSNRWGETSKTVKVDLVPRTEVGTSLSRLLQHLFNARKFAETRQYDQAHGEVDKVLSLDSNLAPAMVMKGSVYFLQGQIADAETWYKKALDKDPGQSEAVQMLEKIRNKKGGGTQ